MIQVEYRDRLGNNLFQYAFGRILAEELGFELQAKPIAGFPGTQQTVEGCRFESPVVEVTDQTADLPKLIADRTPRQLIVRGFFQRFAHYEPYLERIRGRWNLLSRDRLGNADPSAVWVHIRRTDYIQWGSALPFSYYEEAISSLGGGPVKIITDDPSDPFLWRFRKFNAQIVHGSQVDDFHQLASGKKLVLSQSTFSWWAALLSHADAIVCPLHKTAVWDMSLDLRVDDPRYRYLASRESYVASAVERLYQFKRRVDYGVGWRWRALKARL